MDAERTGGTAGGADTFTGFVLGIGGALGTGGTLGRGGIGGALGRDIFADGGTGGVERGTGGAVGT